LLSGSVPQLMLQRNRIGAADNSEDNSAEAAIAR
jgi:hypothetical protein